MKTYYEEMIELDADGIDFVPLFWDSKNPFHDNKIYASYTREEFKSITAVPKTNYRFWKLVNGKKAYIDEETKNI